MKVTQNDIEEYLRHCERESRLSPHTVRAYRIDLRQLLDWLRRKGDTEFDEAAIKGYVYGKVIPDNLACRNSTL